MAAAAAISGGAGTESRLRVQLKHSHDVSSVTLMHAYLLTSESMSFGPEVPEYYRIAQE